MSLPDQALEVVPEVPNLTLFGSNNPAHIIDQAVGVATVLGKVIKEKQLFTQIAGRYHIRVEGWTLCGSMLGVFPVVVWTRPTEEGDGWTARVEARTLHGAVVGAAEAMCTRQERTWKTRDDYALQSMAQTRATSKALRHPLGFIIQLAGYDPTPEEEMPGSVHGVVAPPAPSQERAVTDGQGPEPSDRPSRPKSVKERQMAHIHALGGELGMDHDRVKNLAEAQGLLPDSGSMEDMTSSQRARLLAVLTEMQQEDKSA